MNLKEAFECLDDRVKSLDAAGIVMILALEGAPMLIKIGVEDDHARELCKILSTSEPIVKQ